MPAPAQHVADSWNAAEFYANKLAVALKGKDDASVAWSRGVKELTLALGALVRQHYAAGLKWDPNGVSVAEAQRLAAASGGGGGGGGGAAPAGKGAPPPPPPPLPSRDVLFAERPGTGGSGSSGPAAASGGSGMSDVLKQLSQGAGLTAGLRKVTDAMKAKNREDRSGVVPAGGASGAAAAAAPKGGAAAAAPPAGKPRCGDR